MMINNRFEAYKIAREIKRSGIVCNFKRPVKNEFNEPTDVLVDVGIVVGLYHEANAYVTTTVGNAQDKNTTQIRSKKKPMVLCLFDDVASLSLHVDDRVNIGAGTFRVVDVANIQEWGIVADISLEVINVGVQA